LRSCYRGTEGNTSQMWVLQLCIFKAIGFINAFFVICMVSESV
jgi:hypothetical protein